MKILDKDLETVEIIYEDKTIENEEFIRIILDNAASLNVNHTLDLVTLEQVNSIMKYFLSHFPINKAALLNGISKESFSENHQFITNDVQNKIYSNFVVWFEKYHHTSNKYPNQDHDSAIYNVFYNASKFERKQCHNTFIKKIIGMLPTSAIYNFIERAVRLKTNYRELTYKTTAIDDKTEKSEIEIVPILPTLTTKWYMAAIYHGAISFYKDLKSLDEYKTVFFYNGTTGVMKYTFHHPKTKKHIFPIITLVKLILYSSKVKKRMKEFVDYRHRIKNMDNIVSNWINTHRKNLLKRDRTTGVHVGNVTFYTMLCLMALGVDTKTLRIGILGGLIHDIGKEVIPDEVLNYTKKFTLSHRTIMDDHSLLGAALALNETLGIDPHNKNKSKKELRKNLSDQLAGYNAENYVNNIIEIIILTVEHHEDMKGQGVPYGVSPYEISLVGLVMQVTDVFEALTAKRQYKEAMSIEHATDLIKNQMPPGTFSPNVIALFFNTVLPFLIKTFGTVNFSEHVHTFLTKNNDEHKVLKNALLSLLSSNITVVDRDILQSLDAQQHLKDWARSRSHNIKTIDDFKSNLIRSLRGHFHKLECISVLNYYFLSAEKKFEDEKDEKLKIENILELLKKEYTIPRNIMCVLEKVSWGRRLPQYWENYLEETDWEWLSAKNSELNSIKETLPEYMEHTELISLVKQRYQLYVPFFMPYLEERLDK